MEPYVAALIIALIALFISILLIIRVQTRYERARGHVIAMLEKVMEVEGGSYERESLENLINDYHDLMIERLVRPSNEQKVKFKVLQNQVNPHFLYNTLESIRAIAVVDGEQGLPQIASMTEALARYFRYNISNRNDLVTLEEELYNIEQYMTIQRFRFSDRFTMKITYRNCDRSVNAIMIPKLLLQPIVENSIFHGLEGKTEPGQIEISIADAEGRICISIEDNGTGMSDQTLFELQERIRQKELIIDAEESSHNGVALWQINQQLQTLFGEEYGMHLYSTEGVGTVVELTLPKIIDRDELL